MPLMSNPLILGLALLGALVAGNECQYMACVTQGDCGKVVDCAAKPSACCPAVACSQSCCVYSGDIAQYDYIGQGRCRDANNNGGNYLPVQASGVADCIQQCQEDTQCQGIEYSADGCELHRNKPAAVYYSQYDKLSDCFAKKEQPSYE